MANDDAIMKELGIIKADGKETLRGLNKNSIAIARVEGSIETQNVKIDHNASGISNNKAEIVKVRDSVKNQLIRVAGMGGGIGAIAGYLSSLIK
jgi:hypothetical protein